MSFGLVVDHSQRRMSADRLGLLAGGLEWDGLIWQGTWIDPLTETLMLRPRAFDADWYVSSSGEYAKLGLGEFEPAPAFEERLDQHWAGPWIGNRDSTVGGVVRTTASWGKNRGFVLSWFGYGSGDTFEQIRCGWSDSGDLSSGVGLRFFTDGSVLVVKDGETVGRGQISGFVGADVRRNHVHELLLLPMRGRELMVLSRSGKGFVHVFADIDEGASDPEITPAGKFWVEVVQGAGQFQLAPIRFWQSGTATSLETSFAEAVGLGETLETFENGELAPSPSPFKVYGRGSYGGGIESVSITVVEPDGVSDFVPDGVKTSARLRAEILSSDSGYSPFVMGGAVAYRRLVVDSPDEALDLTGYVTEGVLSVPFDGSAVSIGLRLADAESLEALRPGLLQGGHRPVLVGIGSDVLLDGYGEPMSVELGSSGESSVARMEVLDAWKALDESVFVERVALDDLSFEEVIRLLVERSGVENFVISDPGFMLPFSFGARSGDWGLMIEPGDSAGDWLRRILETFASGWFYGFRPGVAGTEFYAISPDDLSVVPQIELYGEVELAALHSGKVFSGYRQVTLEPEATEVRVTGRDPATGRPLQSVKTDFDAQNCGLSVAMRPANWLGEKRRFGLVDQGITTQSAVDSVCESLFSNKTRVRVLAEFSSELLRDSAGRFLWRGDVVDLVGIGHARILGFGCWFGRESAGMNWREGVYTVEMI